MQPPAEGAVNVAGVVARPQNAEGEGLCWIENFWKFQILFLYIFFSEGAPGQSIADLRNSLNTIVDAMRDFLSEIRVMGASGDADENDSSSDDDVNNLT